MGTFLKINFTPSGVGVKGNIRSNAITQIFVVFQACWFLHQEPDKYFKPESTWRRVDVSVVGFNLLNDR